MGKDHWQNIYKNKADNEVSWTQAYPNSAIRYLEELNLPKSAKLIDIGGGASNFADAALDLGYTDITVLDISEAALARSKQRLGERAITIKWVVSDINNFISEHPYDFWYDRAVFHFLTDTKHINNYIELVGHTLNVGGHFLLGTFSENGPDKCSGLEICQYSKAKMINTFESKFTPINCFKESHITPFDSVQEFQFCGFTKK